MDGSVEDDPMYNYKGNSHMNPALVLCTITFSMCRLEKHVSDIF